MPLQRRRVLGEEVPGTRHDMQGGAPSQSLQERIPLRCRAERIPATYDEEHRHFEPSQIGEVVFFQTQRDANAEERLRFGAGGHQLQRDVGAERKAAQQPGESRIVLFQPGPGGTCVLDLATAVVEAPGAAADASEVEPQDAKAVVYQAPRRTVDGLGVESAAVQGVRMADECQATQASQRFQEQRFQVSGRACEIDTIQAPGRMGVIGVQLRFLSVLG